MATLSALLVSFIFEPLKEILANRFEKIEIASGNVRDVPHINDSKAIPVTFNYENDYFSDYIETNLNFTGEKDIIVDKIQLKNVSFNTYEYIDFGVSANFDEVSQTFSAYAYQNGNASAKDEQFQISLYRIVDNEPIRLKHAYSKVFDFNGGDVAHIFKSSFTNKELLEQFDSSPNQYLLIDIVNSKEIGNELYQVKLPYDVNTKKFMLPGIGGVGPIYQEEENVFVLKDSNQKDYTLRTNFPANDFHKTLSFNLLVSEAAEIEYDIEVSTDGQIIASSDKKNNLHQKVKVRVPKYNIARGAFGYRLAVFMDTNNLEFATYEDIATKASSLVYSEEKAYERYNLVQYDE